MKEMWQKVITKRKQHRSLKHMAAVMAQWIRPWTLNLEFPASNQLAAAVAPRCKIIDPHSLVPSEKTLSRRNPMLLTQNQLAVPMAR